MNIVCWFEMEIAIKIYHELPAWQLHFYASVLFWLDKQEKPS